MGAGRRTGRRRARSARRRPPPPPQPAAAEPGSPAAAPVVAAPTPATPEGEAAAPGEGKAAVVAAPGAGAPAPSPAKKRKQRGEDAAAADAAAPAGSDGSDHAAKPPRRRKADPLSGKPLPPNAIQVTLKNLPTAATEAEVVDVVRPVGGCLKVAVIPQRPGASPRHGGVAHAFFGDKGSAARAVEELGKVTWEGCGKALAAAVREPPTASAP